MQFIKSLNYEESVKTVADIIINELVSNKKVLWFLTGGSSIPACVAIFQKVKESEVDLSRLIVTLTDERYGEVGHKDSSWQKLCDAGFDFTSIQSIEPLRGLTLNETIEAYRQEIHNAFETCESVVACFGVGTDVHIAGLLPESEGVKSEEDIVSYQGPDFMRISLGLNGIRKIQKAFVFMFGENKKQALKSLQKAESDPQKEPAQILHEIGEVMVFSDQI